MTFRYTSKVYKFDVTISANGDTSTSVDLVGRPLIGIKFPDIFKGARLFIDVSVDGTNFVKAYNPQGARMSVLVQAGGYVCIAPDDFRGIRYFRFQSSSIEGAERTISIFGRVD